MNLKHAAFLMAMSFTVVSAAADTKELIEQARTQLQAAGSLSTEEAYLQAEETIDSAVRQDSKNPPALMIRGAIRMERAGWLASKGRFVPANELMAMACADMDAAVAMSPGNSEVRMMRGLMYGRFPTFLNKAPLAREDLEIQLESSGFFRISRGELVNLEYVCEIVPWFSGTYKVRLTTGGELDVSRDRGRHLKEVMNI